jgi:hypothetical protein
MKAVAVAVLMCSVPFTAFAAAPARGQFTGAVQQDGEFPVSIDLHLPAQQTASLHLADGSVLELATAGSSTSPDSARIRLLAPDGQVMHTAVIPDVGTTSISFAYRVCKGQATYMSPAPAELPACGT